MAGGEGLSADFDYNCSVDIADLIIMVNTWLLQEGDLDYNPDCDISIVVDNKVNLADFGIFALEWLQPLEWLARQVPGAITGDGEVDLEDLSILSQQWQDILSESSADIAQCPGPTAHLRRSRRQCGCAPQ